MAAKSRTKGASGEREFCTVLANLIGLPCLERNLEQTRSGGHDLQVREPDRELFDNERQMIDQLNQLAIEIKRYSRATPHLIADWWKQTTRQASRIKRSPTLAFREDRSRWQVIVPFSHERPQSDILGTVRMDIELFAEHLMSGANHELPTSK